MLVKNFEDKIEKMKCLKDLLRSGVYRKDKRKKNSEKQLSSEARNEHECFGKEVGDQKTIYLYPRKKL